MTRVLVVDDERPIVELVRAILVSEGYDVKIATSGNEALASVDGQRLHLVLLDLMMPDMDGCTVLQSLRADARTQKVPVVLMSASGHLDEIARETKVQGKLPKPFNVDELLNCVARYALAEEASGCASA